MHLTKIRTDNSYITVVNLYISPDQDIDTNLLATTFTPNSIIVAFPIVYFFKFKSPTNCGRFKFKKYTMVDHSAGFFKKFGWLNHIFG